MMEDVAVCWFRQDMRLSDNPALSAAAEHHYVLPVYILDTKIREHLSPERQAIGGCIARCTPSTNRSEESYRFTRGTLSRFWLISFRGCP